MRRDAIPNRLKLNSDKNDGKTSAMQKKGATRKKSNDTAFVCLILMITMNHFVFFFLKNKNNFVNNSKQKEKIFSL